MQMLNCCHKETLCAWLCNHKTILNAEDAYRAGLSCSQQRSQAKGRPWASSPLMPNSHTGGQTAIATRVI